MSSNYMIIKTKKLSPREVKKKLHEFIDSISEDCGPEIEEMADELKAHGDSFVDALTGNRATGGLYRDGQYRDGSNGQYRDGQGMGGQYRHGRSWHRSDDERQKSEQKLMELEKQMQELRQQMNEY